ncbi:glycerol-3-phosphate o-acyltransferase [Lentinula edodes]|uniref:Glycerol-3-phosphate o-acyltransferase n=1 Tax=Lentinula edodes TaxID=5353 RepID=A0A1Q3EL77_LENED|nr:glycerol-3-phosphate o-acyltransferase [Lentinula edodes]
MELQLVYRILRKISDWAVTGYYSEILIDGPENVLNIQHGVDEKSAKRTNGPVILCSSHHNEMIDIATLAMTMPKCQGERRHVSFWAKDSMFKNTVGGWVMRSSGAIPVKRNPNKSESAELNRKGKLGKDNRSESLFASTTGTLALGKVVGVFPEGTSYTQPGIVQVMPGAARAAVEYEIWRRRNQGEDIVIIPVGIVYTDKSRYQSRLKVQYGSPISVKEYLDESFSSSTSSSSSSLSSSNASISSSMSYSESSATTYSFSNTEDTSIARTRAATKAVALRIEKALFGLTINAPDWETLYAAGIVRDIIFEGEEVPLNYWVSVSQLFVDYLAPSTPSIPSKAADENKHALTRYFALLHHTGLTHAVLQGLFPLPVKLGSTASSSSTKTPPKDVRFWTDKEWKWYHTVTFSENLHCLFTTSTALNIAQSLAILPVLPPYLCAFLVSRLTARILATPGEEEGEAQFRSVGGGVGLGAGLAFGKVLWYNMCIKRAHTTYTYTFAPPARKLWIHHLSVLLVLRRTLPHTHIFEDPDIVPYLTLPSPPTNAFIRRREQARTDSEGASGSTSKPERRTIATSKLFMALFFVFGSNKWLLHWV